jgi:pimeloyl-ACP methyl ester carboxylesterase
VPVEAARECEDPNYAPAVGACARLPTADLYYRDTGPRNHRGHRDSHKGTVIFTHAGTGNADAFEFQLEAFARAGYRAIAYDRKNVGRSSNTLRDAALGRAVGTTVGDLDALATYLGVKRFHLVGVAAGGQVAIQYAAWNPSRLLSMVLAATLGPPGLGTNEPEIAQFTANIQMPFEVFCPGPVPSGAPRTISPATTNIPQVRAEHRELGASFRGRNRAGVDFYHHVEENARHRTFDGCRFTNIGANQPGLAATDPLNPNTYARLEQIDVRTLVLAGGGDILSPPYGMRLWGSHLPDAQWTMVTDAGHAVQIEAPAIFNERVLRFLRGGRPFERLVKP